jgi:hypothetical protein
MPELFSEEWAAAAGDLWSQLPPAPGAEGVVSLAFGLAARREVAIHWRYEDGRAVEGGPGPGKEPVLALSVSGADAPEVLSGRVEPSVAFMRGRLKAAGEGSVLLAFLSATATEAFAEWCRRIDALAGAS